MPHLLLVDDDKECLHALSSRLRFAFRRHALKVDVADCAATGLILAHQGQYDALLIDVLMPGMSGIKFVEQLRRTQPNVPIVMMSGSDVTAWEDHAARLGLVACLPKPIEFGTLVGLIADILDLENQASRHQERGGSAKKKLGKEKASVHYSRLNLDDRRLHTS
jgi:DNA-binding NtrC family response regulator